MKLKEFFLGRTIVFAFILVIGLGIFAYKTYFPVTQQTEVPASSTEENNEPPVFTWRYEKAESLNLDGFPKTNIFLEAKYSDGTVQSKLIDTTSGSCNDLPDSDKDSIPNSTNIQCYSAGLGYRFKITKGDESYLVERKTFEEALPDYQAPSYEYEVRAKFPLTNE